MRPVTDNLANGSERGRPPRARFVIRGVTGKVRAVSAFQFGGEETTRRRPGNEEVSYRESTANHSGGFSRRTSLIPENDA